MAQNEGIPTEPRPDGKIANKTAVVEKITLERYLETHIVHMGLVASFRHEALQQPDLLNDRTDAEWNEVLQKQSARHY